MEVWAFCCLIGVFIVGSESLKEYYFVTGPNVIRFEHTETIVVNIFGNEQNVPVTVWFEHRAKTFSLKTVNIPSQNQPVETTVGVTENDIFDSVIDEKPRNIKLCSRRRNEANICRDLVLSFKTGYLIVQTDKPIYTPRQKVKIRVLALDESLKRVSNDKWQVAMDIVSPSNLTLARRQFTKTTSSGFYRNEFTLPPYPERGMWTARAFYRGQFETVSRALFQVKEYVLPTFGVSLDVSEPYILESLDTMITITAEAKYVYGKPVDGSARLALNVTDNKGYSEYLLDMPKQKLENGIKEFSVSVNDILQSNALKDKQFPDGYRLLIVATVLESATGKEEATFHDEIIFASRPYIFTFTRSKNYFRPGMEYYVQVDMSTVNKHPAPNEDIVVVQFGENGEELKREPATTNSRGEALAIFSSPSIKTMHFKAIVQVIAQKTEQESDILEVTGYAGTKQIQVERVVKEDNNMLLRAHNNIDVAVDTGMLFLVAARGKVVKSVFKNAGNQVSEQITEELQELINPTARLLVFYVNEGTDNIVADSIKFEVDSKCRGKGLTLEPSRGQVVPGEGDQLKMSGTSLMWVGLNAMDKALLLLNNENILNKNKMFDALAAHDLGCGEGSGRNNGDVFKNAGLTVLTNAKVEVEVDHIIEECDARKRKKRSTEDCYDAHINCCNYGTRYAEDVFNEIETKEEKAKIDAYTKCYGAAISDRVVNNTARCLNAVLYSCMEKLDALISEITQIVSKSLEDISQYASDLEILAQNKVRPYKRTDFRESFLFEEVQLANDGTSVKSYTYPDSITEWLIQGIGITENEGMCIADPVEVRVFREFFIQLDLPYKATRLELFDVKATLFNYGLEIDKTKEANMYMESVEGICYGNDPGKQIENLGLKIGPNSAHTVRFRIIPLKAGLFPITVKAIVTNLGIPEVDVIEKKLYVVNEGIQVVITIQVCLDPLQQKDDCESHSRVTTQYGDSADNINKEQISHVDLTLPPNAIPGTGSGTAYIQGNIMDNVVKTILSGVESLFQCPHGCGEQTIATTAPNVYAMLYLKKTKQETSEIEQTGNTHIRNGVNREKTMFRHSDGSYSCCNNDKHTGIYRPTSVWLTAFVAKVFCHAKVVVDDAIDEQADLHSTINYLNNRITAWGQFTEIMDTRITGTWLRGSHGTGQNPSLTSFVLISLLECNILPESTKRTVDRATHYIENFDENWLKERPFDLALSTYALSLSKSDKRRTFKDWLHSIAKQNGKNLYWAHSEIPMGTKADAYAVETTAYALLAMLQFDDLKTSAFIVRWLTSQQDSYGVFRSTQDTVVGLQALSQYSIRTYSPEVDLKVSMYADDWNGKEVPVKNERFQLQQIVENLPVENKDNQLTVKVSGRQGSGRMRIDLRYNRPAESDEICPFELSDIEVNDVYEYDIDTNIAIKKQCDVCGVCAGDPDFVDYDLLLPSTTTLKPDNADTGFGRRKRQVVDNVRDRMNCIRFDVRAKEGHEHGMSMIYFNLETDVTVLEEDIKKLMKENENLDDFEMPNNKKGFIVFYLNTLTSSHVNNFVFRIVDNFEGELNSRQPVTVDVFDYYNPEQYCRKIYGTGPNKDLSFEFVCNPENEQCKCLQSSCIKSDAIKSTFERNKPAVVLWRRTCNPEKANFAVYVRVTKVWNETKTKNRMALVTVEELIHQGAVRYEKYDTMTFFWKNSCSHPKLEVGKNYFIIAKDGHKIETADGQSKYLYPLTGTAYVIEPETKKSKAAMRNYKMLIKRRKCTQ